MDAALNSLFHYHAHDPDAYRAIAAAVIIAIVLVVDVIIYLFLQQLSKRLEAKRPFVALLAKGSTRPLVVITWLLGLWAIVAWVLLRISPELEHYAAIVQRVVEVVLVLLVTWLFLRATRHAKAYAIQQHTRTDGGYNDFSAIEAISVGVQAIILILSGVSLLFAFGIPLKALAGIGVVGGFGAYALTMANQILISNVFAGFALYFDRPFAVGDWISTKDGRVDGTVTKIGLRLTTIVGFDQRPIYVPNSIFNSNATVNCSRMNNRRIKQFIGLRYEDFDRVEKIMSEIRAFLKNDPAIDQGRTTLVNLINGETNTGSLYEGAFGDSSVNFNVYTFTKTTNWVEFQNIQDRVMFEVARIIMANGARIAHATTTLDVPKGITIRKPETAPPTDPSH